MSWLDHQKSVHRPPAGLPWFIIMVLALICPINALSETVHKCSGAGRWFPADAKELRSQITGFLDAAEVPQLEGRIAALVVPHAGFQYSGPTAAYAYKIIQGKPIKRVILLAFSHSMAISGASVLDASAYETPLGSIPVDRDVVRALLKCDGFSSVEAAHCAEHSDENQLPFLQVALGSFHLVSILVGADAENSPAVLEKLAKAIFPHIDDGTLLVASSDFTHYGVHYNYAPFHNNLEANLQALDGEAAYYLMQRDPKGFLDFFRRTGTTLCGRAPLALLLHLLNPQIRGVYLHSDRSKDPQGSYRMSVGYMALAFPASTPPASIKTPDWIKPAQDRAELDAGERQTLLHLARNTIASRLYTQSGGRLNAADYDITPRLMAAQGAFVTLTESRDLRGCIGTINAEEPLYQNIMRMALQAAFADSRFSPLTKEELSKIHIEISALLTPDGRVDRNPCRKIDSVDQIQVGHDGLTIAQGSRRGLLLPQVPAEFGWDRDQFLRHLCNKAGLPVDASRSAVIERFSAQVFSEETR